MLEDHLKAGGLTEEIRKELIDYYEWIVSLAVFILTISLSLVALFPEGVTHRWLLVVGWVPLGLCVFLNWMLVKRLVTIPLISKVAPESEGIRHKIFKA